MWLVLRSFFSRPVAHRLRIGLNRTAPYAVFGSTYSAIGIAVYRTRA